MWEFVFILFPWVMALICLFIYVYTCEEREKKRTSRPVILRGNKMTIQKLETWLMFDEMGCYSSNECDHEVNEAGYQQVCKPLSVTECDAYVHGIDEDYCRNATEYCVTDLCFCPQEEIKSCQYVDMETNNRFDALSTWVDQIQSACDGAKRALRSAEHVSDRIDRELGT